MSHRLCARIVAAALFVSLPVSVAIADAPPPPQPADVTARLIEHFRIGSDETEFGPLRFVSGLSMVSSNRNFGAMSGFRFLDDGGRFAVVTDTGFLVSGALLRDTDLRPTGWSDVVFRAIPDGGGTYSDRKWEVDAVALEIVDGSPVIGFERAHRIAAYRVEGAGSVVEVQRYDIRVPVHEIRGNRGFEMVARSPVSSPLQGAIVAATEKSIDADGNIFAAIINGPNAGVFKIARRGDFDITDGDFLPDGDLLLLERSYRISSGVKMRIRRIAGDSIKTGALVDGDVILEADMSYQIDNMEGLDVFRAPDGSLRIGLVSDDNKSILQRNLYLEFLFTE